MFKGVNLFLVLLIPILCFLQITIIPFISIENTVPDLLMVLVAYFTVRNGQFFGQLFAAIAGISFDLISGSLIGSTMLAKVLAAFLIGYFYNDLKTEEYINSAAFPLIAFLGSLINSLVFGLISGPQVATNAVGFIISHGLFPAVYTAVFATLVTAFHPKRVLVR